MSRCCQKIMWFHSFLSTTCHNYYSNTCISRELKHRHFWATDVPEFEISPLRRVVLPVRWKCQDVHAKMRALKYSAWAWKRENGKNINFRLTSVAQKRLCLSSLVSLLSRAYFSNLDKTSASTVLSSMFFSIAPHCSNRVKMLHFCGMFKPLHSFSTTCEKETS